MAITSDVKPAPASQASGRIHLQFLDGIRALAALYVVLGHSFFYTIGTTTPNNPLTNWLYYVHFAVDVFLVVSGFCLGLPVARHGLLRDGAAGFLRRRARRILPPFYVALAFSTLVWIVSDKIIPPAPFKIGEMSDVLMNFLLLQDLCPRANWINVVFWSVAVEWKIYFLFPVFVWLWQRRGAAALLAVAALLGGSLTALIHVVKPQLGQDHTCPWFIFLFALGVWASGLAVADSAARGDRRWFWAIGGTLAAVAGLMWASPPVSDVRETAGLLRLSGQDVLIGLLTSCVLIVLARNTPNRGVQASLKALSWKPLARLGQFAYSLYLIHLPLICVIGFLFFTQNARYHGPFSALPMLGRFVALAAGGVPLIVACAYAFFLAFERPFLNTRRAESHAAP